MRVHHDLDDLAGSWTIEQWLEFLENTRGIRKIDEELWG